jgi:hypothetical protein
MGRGDVCGSRQRRACITTWASSVSASSPPRRHHPHPSLLPWLLRAESCRQASTRHASALPINGGSCPVGPGRGMARLSRREARRRQRRRGPWRSWSQGRPSRHDVAGVRPHLWQRRRASPLPCLSLADAGSPALPSASFFAVALSTYISNIALRHHRLPFLSPPRGQPKELVPGMVMPPGSMDMHVDLRFRSWSALCFFFS